ncbi:MAG: CopD family protein [Pseudomonadota bacterium]
MDWVKIIHILAVMGWVTSVFAVPRALIYWRREWENLGEFGPTGDLTVRLYRFSSGLMMIAIVTGLWLGWSWGWPNWVTAKVVLVALLAGHYMWTGKQVVEAKRGIFPYSDRWLRIFNEISVLGVIAILWVVVMKPF